MRSWANLLRPSGSCKRRSPSWDTRHQVVWAEPVFSYVVHDAYALTGRTAVRLAAVRDGTTFLDDGFDTFGMNMPHVEHGSVVQPDPGGSPEGVDQT
ncbi:hypothetical protein [Streptomyces sp. T028]|uniref:hypothetical protein n=1 Tax=Streptomyces sp. T028 TaxID=3394379 RepID=UPI003A8C70F1